MMGLRWGFELSVQVGRVVATMWRSGWLRRGGIGAAGVGAGGPDRGRVREQLGMTGQAGSSPPGPACGLRSRPGGPVCRHPIPPRWIRGAGHRSIAVGLRHYARNASRPLTTLGLT